MKLRFEDGDAVVLRVVKRLDRFVGDTDSIDTATEAETVVCGCTDTWCRIGTLGLERMRFDRLSGRCLDKLSVEYAAIRNAPVAKVIAPPVAGGGGA